MNEFESVNENMVKILDIDSIGGITPFAQFDRPGGGYILIYQPGQANDNFVKVNGLVVVTMDENWNVLHSQSLGGSGNTVLFDAQPDENGNIYLCGGTSSRDIRTDPWGPAKQAGYLAKVDKDARVLWQVAYSDTSTYYKGQQNERFFALELINGKPYCLGPQENHFYPNTPMLIGFDENGNVTMEQDMPPLYKGNYVFSYTRAYTSYGLAKLKNNDLLVRNTRFIFQPVGGIIDTSSYLLRYNTTKNTIGWQRYYTYGSAQGDLTYYGVLGNGNVAFFDTYFNTLNVIDASNGDILRTANLRSNTFDGASNYYFNPNPYMRGTIDGELYFTGAVAKGSQIFGRKPFVIKLDQNGTIAYEKIFNIPEASFYRVSKNADGNLQILGDIRIFKSKRQKVFTTCMDKNGNYIGD